MSTVKFDLQEDLEELQARIFLETRKKLSKKEILEIVFKIGSEHFDQVINEIKNNERPLDDDIIKSVLQNVDDYGEGTERLSFQVDKIVYNLEK